MKAMQLSCWRGRENSLEEGITTQQLWNKLQKKTDEFTSHFYAKMQDGPDGVHHANE